MSSAAQPLLEADEADPPAAWERALLDRQLATLDRLAEMGLALAEVIQVRATEPSAPDTVVQHAAMDFARVSRAVRMTLALQSRLVRDFKTPVASRPAKGAFEDIAPGSLAAVWLQPVEGFQPSEKSRLRDAVRRAAEASGLEAETVERLTAEASERLERDDIDGLMHRPFDEIVAMICEDLGLSPLSPRAPPFVAANGGEGELCDRQGRSCERPPDGRAGLADPGQRPGEERVGVGEDRLHPPFDRFAERPPTWSG